MCNLLKIRYVYGASRKNFRLKNLVSTNFGSNFALAKTTKPTTMRRMYIILALAAMVAVACEKDQLPEDRPNNDSSEINPEDNKNDEEPAWLYDNFMGYDMPDLDERRQEMEATLRVVDSQEGEVDDELFVEMLLSSVMDFSEQYLTEGTYWTSCDDWAGGEYCGTLIMMEDGTCYDHSHEGCAFIEFDSFLHERGYKGTYYTTLWSYDAETHTLNTVYSPDYYNIEMSAEVLYFDGEEAILVGHIAGVAIVAMNKYNNYTTGISHEMELYRLKFTDSRDTFFDGYASPEEYAALKEEFETMYPDYF